MTDRPKSFDAQVMRFMPALRASAKKLSPAGEREELIQDTLLYVFEHWQNFRGDWTVPKSGFYSWLIWQMRSVLSNQRGRKRVPVVYDNKGKYAAMISRPADQESALIAKDIMRHIDDGRDGSVLVRRACGSGLKEVGQNMGLSRERVRQLEERARAALLKVAA